MRKVLTKALMVAAAITCLVSAAAWAAEQGSGPDDWIPVPNESAMRSAGFIAGVLVGRLATFGKCGEADKENEADYAFVAGAYYQEMQPVFGRVNTILRTEMKRAGEDFDSFMRKFTADIDQKFDAEFARMYPDHRAFVAACRETSRTLQAYERLVRPLREEYPAEMRAVDEWR